MRARRFAVFLLVASHLVAYAPDGRAAPTWNNPAEAVAALKKRGDEAMDSLRYDEAIEAYSKGYELSSDPTFLYNRGRVYQARSQYPEALADIERFDKEAKPELRRRVPQLATLLADLRAKVATLTVTSNVEGARVLVRSQQVGVTPLSAPVQLNAGPSSIEVIAEGYEPFRREIDLPGGGPTSVDAALVPKEKTGTLVVKTSGEGTVSIDGKVLGRAPVEATLPEGSHVVSIRSERYKDLDTTAVIVTGQRRELDVTLESKPSIVSRWWFWTGVAGVVVAGSVVTFAALKEKSQPSGDQFAPPRVRGPLTIGF